METFLIHGGKPLRGSVKISGAKNVALKACVVALLTNEQVILHNVPNIRDVGFMLDVLTGLGIEVSRKENTVILKNKTIKNITVDLEAGARLRTSTLVIGPLLARLGEAKIPNPGGCRIGARPIDRHMEGLKAMGAEVVYDSKDGYFHAKTRELHGARIRLSKNTHTGTEALILAAVLAKGQTILENAAEEIEIDNLIELLNKMGAQIIRRTKRTIVIDGVSSLHGADFDIMPDRNEEVTYAIASALTGGEIIIQNSQLHTLTAFLNVYEKAGGKYEKLDSNTTKFWLGSKLMPTDIITGAYPGFMTDWQAPWAVLMTQALGVSTIHESVFESRFSYVSELNKMGAIINFYDPAVPNPETFYNFNWADKSKDSHQGIRIQGPVKLHNAILNISDLRAGATLVLAALKASGPSYVNGIEQIDRGYEDIEGKLSKLGADIKRVSV